MLTFRRLVVSRPQENEVYWAQHAEERRAAAEAQAAAALRLDSTHSEMLALRR